MNDDEWSPPSEAEMKVIEARRERSNKVSKIIGDRLLKGHKMLATTCKVCATIEMADKNESVYCVGCQEVDGDNAKDNPIHSKPDQQRQEVVEPLIVPKKAYLLGSENPGSSSLASRNGSGGDLKSEVQSSIQAISRKMSEARKFLDASELSVDTNTQLINLIKDCAECIQALQKIV